MKLRWRVEPDGFAHICILTGALIFAAVTMLALWGDLK